jgi:hypothetical protein
MYKNTQISFALKRIEVNLLKGSGDHKTWQQLFLQINVVQTIIDIFNPEPLLIIAINSNDEKIFFLNDLICPANHFARMDRLQQ